MRRIIPLMTITLLLLFTVSSCRLLDRGRPRPGPVADAITIVPAPDGDLEDDLEPTPGPTPDITMLEWALHHDDWSYRIESARSLAERDDIPMDQRVDMLVAALESEIEGADGTMPDHAYLPVSGVMRLQYTRGLSELGAAAVPALRRAIAETEGEARDHAILALGHLGQRDVIPQLRDMLRDSDSVEIRMEAARVLGILGASEAIPDLEAALDDWHMAHGRDSLGEYTIYPVREQAAGALEALGVDVERLEDDEFRVRRP
jgi:hypothetical protein